MSKPPLMPVEDALDQLFGMANQQRLADSELLALDDARGRVLASDLVATLDLPPWLQCQLTRHHRWQASSHRFCVHTQYQASPQIIVGAGLPAMRPCQPTSMPTDPPPLLASQLPQVLCTYSISSITTNHCGSWLASDEAVSANINAN